MDLFQGIYYLSLFSGPILLYFIFIKSTKKTKYSKAIWYHIFKKLHSKERIRKFQEKSRLAVSVVPEDELEVPKKIRDARGRDAHVICGCDTKGNSIVLKIILREHNYAEVILQLTVKDRGTYVFPTSPNVLVCSTVSKKWKAENLEINVLEPFKRLRITYNGLLKKLGGEKVGEELQKNEIGEEIHHVKFNFIWNCGSAPVHYPHDVSVNILANALSREPWKDRYWIEMLDTEKGYEQYGELKGIITGTNFPEELTLNLPSWRHRYYGASHAHSLNRDLSLLIIANDGTMINIGAKSYRQGCTHIKYGSVITSNGTLIPVDDNDINLEYLGESGILPDLFVVHVNAKKRTYKCVCHVNTDSRLTTVSEEHRGWKMDRYEAECDVNIQQGRALITTWYKKQGNRWINGSEVRSGSDLPPCLLTDIKRIDKDPVLVSSLSSKDSKILSLTGGKGNSLALLSSMNSTLFTVPEGFVITVDAFLQQISKNERLQQAISKLEAASVVAGANLAESNFAAACKECVELFSSEEIDEEIKAEIVKFVEEMKEECLKKQEDVSKLTFAIRSSGVGEDSEDLSAAGQNSTFLGCASEESILKAVGQCWGSLFSFQSVQYRKQHGQSVRSDIAVVVQRMIPSDVAGVLFTCHPTTGDLTEMIVTSNYGLGESVVSGQTDPDTIVLQRNYQGNISIKSKNIGAKKTQVKLDEHGNGTEILELGELSGQLSLSEEQLVLLGQVGVQVEKAFGGPRDIEWAFFEDKLYLLQSRPVTTINTWSDYELLHEFDRAIFTDETLLTRANVGEVTPGATTVLTNSTVSQGLENAIQLETFKGKYDAYRPRSINLQDHHLFLDVFNGLYNSIEKEISLNTKVLDLSVFGHPVIDKNLHTIALSRNGSMTRLDTFNEFKDLFKKSLVNAKSVKEATRLGRTTRIDISDKDTCLDVLNKIENFLPIFLRVVNLHCKVTRVSIFNQFIAMNVLAGGSTDLTTEHYEDISFLLSSCEGVVSAEVPVVLGRISQIIFEKGFSEEFVQLKLEACEAWMKVKTPEAYQEFKEFIRTHGHRSLKEFELITKTWGMDSSRVMGMIQANAKNKTFTMKAKLLSVSETISRLKSPKNKVTKYILKWLIERCRKAVKAREDTKSELIRTVNTLRLAYRKLGQKMVQGGFILDPELIFHFTHRELRELITKRNPILTSKALRRQRLYTEWDGYKYPEMSFGHPTPLNEKHEISLNGTNGLKLNGTPVYPGNVIARCSVISDLAKIDQLQSGDILITHCTDIGWSPYFPMLAGIVTELGGLISHGAVVAREYGLPCIVGISEATSHFKTGDTVLLNGKMGTLELISREE